LLARRLGAQVQGALAGIMLGKQGTAHMTTPELLEWMRQDGGNVSPARERLLG
jgi:hypothetical protein